MVDGATSQTQLSHGGEIRSNNLGQPKAAGAGLVGPARAYFTAVTPVEVRPTLTAMKPALLLHVIRHAYPASLCAGTRNPELAVRVVGIPRRANLSMVFSASGEISGGGFLDRRARGSRCQGRVGWSDRS